MISLDQTGNPLLTCDLKQGFSVGGLSLGDVRAFVVSGNSLYVGGTFSAYQGQSANYIAKLNLPDCQRP